MANIAFEGRQGSMAGNIMNVPAFPGVRFSIGYPEAIGDAARACWFGSISPAWESDGAGVWKSTARKDGEVSYTMIVTPHEDFLDIHFAVKNESDRAWKQSLAFNCFQCGGVAEIRDHECLRHWVGHEGQLKRLVEVPRKYGPRPAIQLYDVEGAPPGKDVPFVANFKTTPDIVLEGWMAIRSKDGNRLVATVSKPALFLFQNMEYSCIHSATGFGPFEPGASAEGMNRIYFVESSLEDWRSRMKREL